MGNIKSVLAVAVGSFLPCIGQAAIDDAGMKYVSAAEGLSGSIRVLAFNRVQLFEVEETTESKPQIGFGSSRLIYRGESVLGGGLQATYFIEFRPVSGRGAPTTQYIDVGLKGSFGHVRFGDIQSVTEAIVPSADRTSDIGTSGRSLIEDYDRGIRWVSPDIKGVVFGMSVDTNADDVQGGFSTDSLADKYDVAVSYSSPLGIHAGVSYGFSRTSKTREEDVDKSGGRVGLTYVRDNWGVGYNFHSYRAVSAPELGLGFDSKLIFLSYFTVGSGENSKSISSVDKLPGTRYREHVVGVNYDYGRFRIAYVYSRASIKNEAEVFEVGFLNSMADVAYKIGSKSRLVIAYSFYQAHWRKHPKQHDSR